MKNSTLAIVLAGLLCACTVVSPDPGQQAVLVDKPLLFGKGESAWTMCVILVVRMRG